MYQRSNTILIIIALAFLVGVSSIWYSNTLVTQLAKAEENRVSFYADVLKYVASQYDCETEFLFNHLIKVEKNKLPVINVPSIITDSSRKIIGDNLNLSDSIPQKERDLILNSELEMMKANTNIKPIPIEYVKGKFNYVYYRESDVLKKLRYYPYVAFILIGFFIFIVLVIFWITSKSEQNKVWVGLAKETAHQLGTPISGLMAWVELLKLRENMDESDQMVIDELEKDIKRLENITERFSKIGSEPELTIQEVEPILYHSYVYLQSRISKSGKVKVSYKNEIPEGKTFAINKVLFEWVVENLLKNAMDAIDQTNGEINIHGFVSNNHLIVEVSDSGKGIPKNKFRSVFKPGFTTKKRGWGLGLSLSKRIIENYHNGKIYVHKSELGKGTTFRIELY